MPGLTPERIKFLNRQLKNQGAYSPSYLSIVETPSTAIIPEGIVAELKPQYKLVRKASDTGEVWPAFDASPRPEVVGYKSSEIERALARIRILNTQGLNKYKEDLQKNFKENLAAANLALYHKELGVRPDLSTGPAVSGFLLLICLIVASTLLSIAFPPLAPILAPIAIIGFIGIVVGPLIINHFMKKRFDKKAAATPQEAEVGQELDALCNTYCTEHKITPSWTVESVAEGDNEDQLFNVVRPWVVKPKTIEPSSEDILFNTPIKSATLTA